MVTHRGYIPFLPRSVGLAYFSSEATACLISLGYVQSRGGSYRSVGLSKLAICAPGGAVIDIADIGPNRLPAVSSRLLSTVVPPSLSTRVKDSAVRPRPVPFRLSTSGPISLAKSSLRVSKGFCLAAVASPLLGGSPFSSRASGPLPLMSRLPPVCVSDDLRAPVGGLSRRSLVAPSPCP